MQKVKVDWEKIIEKSITGKCEAIFEALKWDISEVKEIKITKKQALEELKKRGVI